MTEICYYATLKKLPNNPRIYPILVLDDSSICVPGLNYILNDEFQKQLRALDIKIKVHPLVIVELDTLNQERSKTFSMSA